MANKIDNPLFPVSRPAGRTVEVARAGSSDAGKAVDGPEAAAPVKLEPGSTVVEMASAQPAPAAPMDMARVQAVRQALESGTYRIDPDEIANRLLALERELRK